LGAKKVDSRPDSNSVQITLGLLDLMIAFLVPTPAALDIPLTAAQKKVSNLCGDSGLAAAVGGYFSGQVRGRY
jgi:hypothetical protein